jgi:hypothetical protein
LAAPFHPSAYGEQVAKILALDGNGERLMPLAGGTCSSAEARHLLHSTSAEDLLSISVNPPAAFAGLWLYFSCRDEAHDAVDDVADPDGSYWHAIIHRQEPDAGNSSYWFRQTGQHPIFPQLFEASREIFASNGSEPLLRSNDLWDPFAFIELCEEARRQPGSTTEQIAREIQRVEWQLLFDHCARPRR